MKATKIVATLGPASDSVDIIAAMIEVGADVFRLNFSHGTPEDHAGRANRVREAAARVGRGVAIMGLALLHIRHVRPAGLGKYWVCAAT